MYPCLLYWSSLYFVIMPMVWLTFVMMGRTVDAVSVLPLPFAVTCTAECLDSAARASRLLLRVRGVGHP